MTPPLPRRRLWFVLFALVALAGLGQCIRVQAKLEGPPVVQPYDPLPRW